MMAEANPFRTLPLASYHNNDCTMTSTPLNESSVPLLPLPSPMLSHESASGGPLKMRISDLTVPTHTTPLSAQTNLKTANGSAGPAKTRARWKTDEFKVYFAVVIVSVAIMAWIPYPLSNATHPNYPMYERRLSPGWIFGRKVDNSDAQYRSFRSNLLPLSIFILTHTLLKRLLLSQTTLLASFTGRRNFELCISLIWVTVLHGTSAVKLLAILGANFWLAKRFAGKPEALYVIWGWNIAVLFANDYFGGYRFSALGEMFSTLDLYGGIYPRWHINYNITMLRLVSFSLDHYWASRASSRPLTESSTQVDPSDPKSRTSTAHPLAEYTFASYTSYVLFAPLYIAGPVVSFNDFLWQLKRPPPIPTSGVGRYAVRFAVCMLTMEGVLHFMYVVAIKDTKAWFGPEAYTAAQLAMVGFWNLVVVWLKLMLPWRLFRLHSLLVGVDPPENMLRCVADNYSGTMFWRGWHVSFNRWLIRYIYVPLSGSKSSTLVTLRNTLVIFTFVALWHDLTFRLLAWGWLVVLFILPELVAKALVPAKKFGGQSWYTPLSAFAGALNVLLMMAANLVGFVLGTDGVKYFVERLIGSWDGLRFLAISLFALYCGVRLMFEYREEEKRNGINRRC